METISVKHPGIMVCVVAATVAASKEDAMTSGKHVLFVCGSPRGDNSSSGLAARYLSHFLTHPFEFVDVCTADLSSDAAEAEQGFQELVGQMRRASCLVWVFGAVIWHAPVQLKLLFDKLFQQGHTFEGRIAATVLAGGHLFDEDILDGMRLISEQLGFGYLGDVSVEGVPGGYGEEELAESACRILARTIDTALDEATIPIRESAPWPREALSPLAFGQGSAMPGTETKKTGNRRIVVVTGHRLDRDPAARAVCAILDQESENTVSLFAVEDSDVGACLLRQECLLRRDLSCPGDDGFPALRRQLLEADGVVFVGQCASTLVDAHLLTLIGRLGSLLIMPQLTGKYGLAVATGGYGQGGGAARYLSRFLTGCGVYCVGSVTQGAGGGEEWLKGLRWQVSRLDRALREQWKAPGRCLVRTEHYFQREMAARYGAVLEGYYRYYQRNRLFDFPPLGLTRILAALLPGRRVRDFLLRQSAKRTRAGWEKRLRRDLAAQAETWRETV
jgi:multimeric flavodoxin WrbA/mannitol/fructose-specific phosphotransferase system IIA component (Ntr-type)